MKKTLAIFAIMATSTFAAEITGYVGDSMCGAKHVKGTEADAKCSASCMKKGDKAVLVTPEEGREIRRQDSHHQRQR
jgi:hypothetical protein